jgi:hypothetical protein
MACPFACKVKIWKINMMHPWYCHWMAAACSPFGVALGILVIFTALDDYNAHNCDTVYLGRQE